MTQLESRQVAFWPTIEFALKHAAANGIDLLAEMLPAPGTPAWCALADEDPTRAGISLMLGGCREALEHERQQEARAEASQAVSTAADWPAVAREVQQRNSFRQSRPWAKREVAS